MREEHPTIEDFARFLQQSPRPSQPERNALIVRHLLGGCGDCRRILNEFRGGRRLLSRLLEIPLHEEQISDPHSYEYEWAFAKTERALATTLKRGQPSERLPDCLATLAGLAEGEQIRRVSAGGRFADPELVHCLIERSHGARYRSPRKTLHLARLAYLAAEACSPEASGGAAGLADLRARAWGQYGNALRISGRPREAEEAFTSAQRHYEKGTGDPLLRAWLIGAMASLAMFQNRFSEAIARCAEGSTICQALKENHLLATILVLKASATLYSGAAEEAVDILNQAITLMAPDEDPHLILAAHHNLARCYIDLDRPEEALALHHAARDLYQECQDPLILLRATWQEGILLREVGHLHNSEAALLRARQGFTEQGLAYEVALVSLDLAEVYSKLDDVGQLRRVIAEALPIFQSLRIGREVLASLLQLQQATEGNPSEGTDAES